GHWKPYTPPPGGGISGKYRLLYPVRSGVPLDCGPGEQHRCARRQRDVQKVKSPDTEVARYCSRDRRKAADRAREKVAMRAGPGAQTRGVSEATRPARMGRSRVRPLTNFTF